MRVMHRCVYKIGIRVVEVSANHPLDDEQRHQGIIGDAADQAICLSTSRIPPGP
jgi:hypothetical protein